MEVTPPRDGRYEFHSVSMIDLIQFAYGWLEMDRFEAIANGHGGKI